MVINKATAHWNGTLREGSGEMKITGHTGPFTFASRFEDGKETNPEELIGAAHAGCYSMFLTALLNGEGFKPEDIKTEATVTLLKDDKGPYVNKIHLESKVACAGLTESKFKAITNTAKENCPISRLYAGGTAEITLHATLA